MAAVAVQAPVLRMEVNPAGASDRAKRRAQEAGAQTCQRGGVLHIEGDGDLARVCDEVEWLLQKSDAQIYQRGGMLVRIVRDSLARDGLMRDAAAPRIVPFDDVSMVEIITRHLEVRRRNRKTQELVRVDCPRAVAQTLLARREWSFPRLETVVEHPVMLADGSVLWESQYHGPSGILLDLPFASFMSFDSAPSRRDAEQCLEELLELLEGFDFVDPVDESVALAYLLTPFVRPLLPTSPAFAFDAHAAGSGKSTLVRTGALLATGRDPAFLTYGDDPTELRKLLFAALLEGDQQIAIDNIDIPVAGAELAVILTSPMYRGRVLGQSVNASVPTKATITLNGNNLQIVGDLTRRVLVSQLDPMCERPAERVFRSDPLALIRSMRGAYVHQALTIMSAYIASGERVTAKPFGSFEEWSRLVREPLMWLGLPDPVQSIRVLEAADPEREQLRSMVEAVHQVFGTREFKAGEALTAAKTTGRQGDLGAFGDDLAPEYREALAEALQAVCERNGELSVKALGRWLLRMQGRIHSDKRFVRVRESRTGAMWKLESLA